MKHTRSSLLAVVAIVFSLFLTGCAGWKWFDDNKPALEFAVKVAVVDLIDQDKVDGARVIEVAEAGSKFLDANPKAQAGEIIAAVHKEIKWDKLTAGQAILAESLLTVIQEKITADIEKGVVDADAKASVREIISWVKEGATMAMARQAYADSTRSDAFAGIGKETDNISAEAILIAVHVTPAPADRRPGI